MSTKIFKSNPNLKECFVTSDGKPFYTENAAKNHAKTLTVKSVVRVERPSGSKQSKAGSDDQTAEKPLKNMNKAELTEKAVKLEIDLTGDETNKEITKLIEEKLASSPGDGQEEDNK